MQQQLDRDVDVVDVDQGLPWFLIVGDLGFDLGNSKSYLKILSLNLYT